MGDHVVGGTRVGRRNVEIGLLTRRPALWPEALRALFAHRRRGVSFSLDSPLLDWRRYTAYGTAATPIDPDDLVAYLSWRRRERRARQ